MGPQAQEPQYVDCTPSQRTERLRFPNPCDYADGNFRQTFRSPFEQYQHRIGHAFTVVGSWVNNELEEPEIMYRIRFEDGAEIDAWGMEVCN